MSEHDPEGNEQEPSPFELMRGMAVAAMLSEAMEMAVNEFVEVRWPHLLEHGAVTDEDGGNPFTGGTVTLFLSMVELKTLDKLFMEMRRQETLPDTLCPLASTVHSIVTRTGEAEQHVKVHEHAQSLRPENPGMN